jgi:transcriptional regulator with XRE-family HTH domain
MPRRAPSYTEVLEILASLPVAVREARRRDGLSIRDVRALSGASTMSISRFERGEDVSHTTAVRLLTWLARPRECGPPTPSELPTSPNLRGGE